MSHVENPVSSIELVQCPSCRGKGVSRCCSDGMQQCSQCNGKGIRKFTDWGVGGLSGKGAVGVIRKKEQCITCQGTGKVGCTSCGGTGSKACQLCKGKKVVSPKEVESYKKKNEFDTYISGCGCAIMLAVIVGLLATCAL